MSLEPNARLDRIHSCGGLLIRLTVGSGMALLLLLYVAVVCRIHPIALVLVASSALATIAMLSTRRLGFWSLLAACATLLATLIIGRYFTGQEPTALFEGGALLLTVLRVVWKVARPTVVQLTLLLTVAVATMPLRAVRIRLLGPQMIFVLAAMLVLVATAAGVGLYLRALDARRARALSAARQGERLELARELHDFVAHHVTGIVVQAQAARFVARAGTPQSAEQVDAMLGDIEKAGTEALTSMRRLVGLLRDGDGATVRPVGGLDQLVELISRFTHPPAVLSLDPDLPDLPPEIATTIHRVVQEALTNARKHAADATAIRVNVNLRTPGQVVEVSVRDNGQGRGRRLPSGRYGLAGLAERVEACGGRLRAGVRPEGGWEVVAVLPLAPVLRQLGP